MPYQRFSSISWLLALGVGLCSGPLNAQTAGQSAGVGSPWSREATAAANKRLLPAGTANQHVLEVHMSDFMAVDSSVTTEELPISGVGGLRETTAGTVLVAAVHLPSGALIDSFELDACDTSATNVGKVTLLDCPDVAACTPLASASTVVSTGCTFWFSPSPLGVTVQNYTDSYTLRTDWPNDPNLGLRGVKVYYSLRVSPAPLTATFADVPTSYTYFRAIEALAASGITSGCGGGNFCPNQAVTRGELAKFLANALGLNWPY